MKNEIWKSLDGIVECGTYYEVSNFGVVRSVDRTIEYIDGRKEKYKGKMIKQHEKKGGYFSVLLSKNNKRKNYYVHRLVALAFIPNPNNLPQINHKDENPNNNNVSNLEWCTMKYNNNYGSRIENIAKSNRKKVKCVNIKSGEVKIFESITIASEEMKADKSTITKCCNGKNKSHKGCKWEYIKE